MILIGPIFYILGDPNHRSFTAFIPTGVGILILIFGLIARDPNKRKFGMHGAVGVALLGFLASIGRAPKVIAGFPGLASIATILMAALCLILVIMGVRSFILARRVL